MNYKEAKRMVKQGFKVYRYNWNNAYLVLSAYKRRLLMMEENTSNQEVLQVTVNGNCSFFVPAIFQKYLDNLKEITDGASSPYTLLRLEGYADYNLREKSEVTCKVTDCIRVSQFLLPD